MLLRKILFALVLCCIFGCKDDCDDFTNPDCENYDRCRAAPAPTADFEVFVPRSSRPLEDGELYTTELIIQDSTYGGRLYFRSTDDFTAEYTYDWTIGLDDREETRKEWNLIFRAETADHVDITLEVDREILSCPERGEESATRTRRIVLLDSDDPTYDIPYLGWYVGNNEQEPNEPAFAIELFKNELGGINLRNFPRNARNDGDRNTLGILSDYQSFTFSPTLNVCCRRAYGTGTFSDGYDSIRIEYQTWDFEAEEWIEDVFTGVRRE